MKQLVRTAAFAACMQIHSHDKLLGGVETSSLRIYMKASVLLGGVE